MQQRADAQNKRESTTAYTADSMRAVEYQEFVWNNQFPPGSWERIEEFLGKPSKRSSFGHGQRKPLENRLCRECLQPCEWIWYECFPGPLCGSAGWVAVCRPCKSWYHEISCVIS